MSHTQAHFPTGGEDINNIIIFYNYWNPSPRVVGNFLLYVYAIKLNNLIYYCNVEVLVYWVEMEQSEPARWTLARIS